MSGFMDCDGYPVDEATDIGYRFHCNGCVEWRTAFDKQVAGHAFTASELGQVRLGLETTRLRAERDRDELAAAFNKEVNDHATTLEKLDAAISLLRECHGQYGMPIGIDERIEALLKARP